MSAAGVAQVEAALRRCHTCSEWKAERSFPFNGNSRNRRKTCRACYKRRWRRNRGSVSKVEDIARRKALTAQRQAAVAARWEQERAAAALRPRQPRPRVIRGEWHSDLHVPGMTRVQARKKVANALRLGHLTKPAACEHCRRTVRSSRLHAHHDDYERPLAITWLCRQCHTNLHGHTC